MFFQILQILSCVTKHRTKKEAIKESICTVTRDQIYAMAMTVYSATCRWENQKKSLMLIFISSHIWRKAKCHYRLSQFHITLFKCRHLYNENNFLTLYSPCRDLDNSKIQFTHEMDFSSH